MGVFLVVCRFFPHFACSLPLSCHFEAAALIFSGFSTQRSPGGAVVSPESYSVSLHPLLALGCLFVLKDFIYFYRGEGGQKER